MPAPLCFVDTETTGIHPGRRPWEIAIIRREVDGAETEKLLHVADVDISQADPFGLKVGGFYDRHVVAKRNWSGLYFGTPDGPSVVQEREAAQIVEAMTRSAHIVGAVPNFDTETLDAMLRRHQLLPAWHYHLVDVEALAVGYLHGLVRDVQGGEHGVRAFPGVLPWKSDDLSRACGVLPPSDDERHTALGDARWAMRLYDAIVGKQAA